MSKCVDLLSRARRFLFCCESRNFWKEEVWRQNKIACQNIPALCSSECAASFMMNVGDPSFNYPKKCTKKKPTECNEIGYTRCNFLVLMWNAGEIRSHWNVLFDRRSETMKFLMPSFTRDLETSIFDGSDKNQLSWEKHAPLTSPAFNGWINLKEATWIRVVEIK